MQYQSLIKADETTIQSDERKFLNLHREILYCGSKAVSYVVEMAMKLKEMRDGKLFLAAEFESFGEYVEQAVGIKERQAYNYISILENLPEAFLQSNANLGITKLALLAPLSESERTEIVENVDIESSTVKELKAQIAELQNRNQQLQMDLDGEVKSSDEKITAINLELQEKVKVIDYLRKQANEVTDLKSKLSSAESKLKTANLEKSSLEKQVQDLKNKPAEKITVQDTETVKALEEAKAKESELNAEIETLRKKLIVASDTVMSRFKVKFEDFQRIGAEILMLIANLDEEKAQKCRNALKTVIERWKLL